MKNILLLIAFAITTNLSFGQNISDVSQSGINLTVRDEKGNWISQKAIGSNDELCGFSSTIIVIRSGINLTVYDQKFNWISQKAIGSGDRVKNVSGNNIIIKSGINVITYDKKFNWISQRTE
jgi:hypothetical protein